VELTVEERLDKLFRLQPFAAELRHTGRDVRKSKVSVSSNSKCALAAEGAPNVRT
jgi:hypothetical protein